MARPAQPAGRLQRGPLIRPPRGAALALALAAPALLIAGLPSTASARNAYVADYKSETVAVIDVTANQLVKPPLEAGVESGPYSLAITPDGVTTWVVNYDGANIASLDTATNLFIGAPIPITQFSYGFGITPDGTRAYVANNEDDTVEVVDLQARTRIGAPIPVGEGPGAIAITPDGTRVYVSNEDADTVSVIDTATNQPLGPPILVGENPFTSALTPDGRFVFVPVKAGVSVIDTASNQLVGPPIPIGAENVIAVAISPDGTRAYAAARVKGPGSVVVIDVATKQVIGGPIPVPSEIEFLAVTPDGKRLLVEQIEPAQVSTIDTATNQVVDAPLVFGGPKGDGQIAVVPDQSPAAAFTKKGTARPGVPYGLNGSSSTDSDGAVASWAWAFGDRTTATTTAAKVSHAFRKPGQFKVTLTVTDNEGCSVLLVFTGQTASCHGSPGAAVTKTVKVAYPGVRVKCPKSADAPCRFKLEVVARKGKKLKAETAAARARVRPGKKAVVSLRPKKKFAKKLAKAKRALVQQVVTIDGEQTSKLSKLKIVQ